MIRTWCSFRLLPLTDKPLAVLALLKNFILAKLPHKKAVLRGVDIVTTYSCNLVCRHCNIQTMEKEKCLQLTYEDYERIERECSELGVFQYTFTGGEPLLRKDLDKLVAIFKPAKRIMIVQTNGQPVKTLEKAQWLKRIGIDIVNVSLDSGLAEEHDANRGLKGHFEMTLKCLSLCKKAGLKIMAGTVLSHQNLHSRGIQELIEYARKERLILILNLAAPAGMWSHNKEILLDEADQLYIRKLIRENPYLRMDMDSTINRYGCPAFKEKLYITPYGDVTGCTFVQISVGNLKERSLEEIRNKGLELDLMKEFAPQCYCAENKEFIEKYMSQLGEDVPKHYTKVMEK